MDVYNKTFRRGLRAKSTIDDFTITDISNEELEEILKPFIIKKDVIVKSNDEIYLSTARKDENETSI